MGAGDDSAKGKCSGGAHPKKDAIKSIARRALLRVMGVQGEMAIISCDAMPSLSRCVPGYHSQHGFDHMAHHIQHGFDRHFHSSEFRLSSSHFLSFLALAL